MRSPLACSEFFARKLPNARPNDARQTRRNAQLGAETRINSTDEKQFEKCIRFNVFQLLLFRGFCFVTRFLARLLRRLGFATAASCGVRCDLVVILIRSDLIRRRKVKRRSKASPLVACSLAANFDAREGQLATKPHRCKAHCFCLPRAHSSGRSATCARPQSLRPLRTAVAVRADTGRCALPFRSRVWRAVRLSIWQSTDSLFDQRAELRRSMSEQLSRRAEERIRLASTKALVARLLSNSLATADF